MPEYAVLTQPKLSFGGIQVWSVLWRFVLVASLSGLLALRFGDTIAQCLIPLFHSEIESLDGTFRVNRLFLDQDGPDRVIRLEVGLSRQIVMNGHVVNPDPRGKATASTIAGHVTLPAIIAIATAFAFRARRLTAYLWRALALVPALMCLWMIDVPFILLASIWGLVIQMLDPGRFSGLRMWSVFLQGGGELALAAVIGVTIGVLVGSRIGQERADVGVPARQMT